jgi:hypothetical protein
MTPTLPEKIAEVKADQRAVRTKVRTLRADNRKTRSLVIRSHRKIMAALADCKNTRPCTLKAAPSAPLDPMPRAWFEFLGKVLAGALLLGSVVAGAVLEYRKDPAPLRQDAPRPPITQTQEGKQP